MYVLPGCIRSLNSFLPRMIMEFEAVSNAPELTSVPPCHPVCSVCFILFALENLADGPIPVYAVGLPSMALNQEFTFPTMKPSPLTSTCSLVNHQYNTSTFSGAAEKLTYQGASLY